MNNEIFTPLMVSAASSTSVSIPAKEPLPKQVVRIDIDREHEQAILSDAQGRVLMRVPAGRLAARLVPGEVVAFFWAEIGNGILELDERAARKHHWKTAAERGAASAAAERAALPLRVLPMVIVPRRLSDGTVLCPGCDLPTHKGMCRDAIRAAKGLSPVRWQP